MHKGFLKAAFILAAFSVAMGAFGSHGLKGKVGDDAVAIFETAVRYQFFHAMALALAGILFKEFTNRYIKAAGFLFIVGIILFCGSLYILTYLKATVSPNGLWVGAITPIGGSAWILGWGVLARGIYKRDEWKFE